MNTKAQRRIRTLVSHVLAETGGMMGYMIRRMSHRTRQTRLQKLAASRKQWRNARRNFESAVDWIQHERHVDWDALEAAGLSGDTLEWKADLFFEALRKPKPTTKNEPAHRINDYTLPKSGLRLSWFKRAFQLGKRIIKSLKDALLTHPWVKILLEAILEYVECVEATMEFRQQEEDEPA